MQSPTPPRYTEDNTPKSRPCFRSCHRLITSAIPTLSYERPRRGKPRVPTSRRPSVGRARSSTESVRAERHTGRSRPHRQSPAVRRVHAQCGGAVALLALRVSDLQIRFQQTMAARPSPRTLLWRSSCSRLSSLRPRVRLRTRRRTHRRARRCGEHQSGVGQSHLTGAIVGLSIPGSVDFVALESATPPPNGRRRVAEHPDRQRDEAVHWHSGASTRGSGPNPVDRSHFPLCRRRPSSNQITIDMLGRRAAGYSTTSPTRSSSTGTWTRPAGDPTPRRSLRGLLDDIVAHPLDFAPSTRRNTPTPTSYCWAWRWKR